MARALRYSFFAPPHGSGLTCGFACISPPPLAPVFPFPACPFHTCPHSSVYTRYRNLNLLSIGYASRPRLRPRLTQSRSALLWKPWIFGRKDSHLPLATHSGILSSIPSTAPCRYRFLMVFNAPLPMTSVIPELRQCVSAPDIFGAGPLDQ